MKMVSKNESFTQLVVLLALQAGVFASVDDIIGDARVIMRESRSIRRWAEAACNGVPDGRGGMTWGDTEEAKKERADSRAWKRINIVVKKYRLTITSQNDPRGWMVRISDGKNIWGY
jgi:hypothetical protein